ncbi:MAG: 3-dehydroquinate synthase [Luteibaculaceae bacterium]
MLQSIENPFSQIFIGHTILTALDEYLSEPKFKDSKFFILGDSNTMNKCLGQLIAEVENLNGCNIIEVEAGEESKSIEIASQLWGTLLDYEVKRNDILINLGGGMITDLGGFIASTFNRGMRFIHIPTTLLGMVDASIGGKTGINLEFHKNKIGTFAQPEAIFIDTQFLETLPKREFSAAIAEIAKIGLTSNRALWEMVTNAESNDITKVISLAVQEKVNIVTQDEKEQGVRKMLNFGHTFGHAFESISHQPDQHVLLHGEAIALGIFAEVMLSSLEGLLKEEEAIAVNRGIKNLFREITLPTLDKTEVYHYLKSDKKNKSEKINFTLLASIGVGKIDVFPSQKNIETVLENFSLFWNQA